ncbi:MAG: hypothetical protein UR89_C0006G0004 [Candidatus Roizmanbacteria bacterium GW2011_GWA2_35_8]|uniref:Phosphohexomutase n=1 Tax=Candidatus Roizmanbacteria bacterium GW2011_GWA2_35_8 TaxID=1618479 RepID=A0A0G0D1C1_9BACT|nr:MAG: hypothetical protein UR89_C0006G0004 [Candidatus Roizmanbacteria bacterium GW2011_GWA2_35_8]
MKLSKKPYLIIPKLIEQPTWGGRYILGIKNWCDNPIFKNKKIGQSYELFSRSKLLLKINNTSDKIFLPELGDPNTDRVFNKLPYKKNIDYITLKDATDLFNKIPLIKINQSNGNSFQLHIRPGFSAKRWLPKAESWYYLKDGLITFGLKKNININEYKKTCVEIEKKMKDLSKKIKDKSMTIEEGNKTAKEFIKTKNPWKFVNIYHVKKDTVVDASYGGIHHSWEEDIAKYPDGNVNFEIQQDVMDPVSTIRSFDKGKFKKDGSIREIHIDDYFKYLDTNPDHNDIKKMTPIKNGNRYLTTKHYRLDVLKVSGEIEDKTNKSFVHLFIRKGSVEVKTDEGQVKMTKGHSCFISEKTLNYKIKSLDGESIILKTFIET